MKKTTMKKTLIITAAVLSVVFITSNAFSWGRGYGRGCGGGYNSGSSVLPSLSEEQKGKLADLRQKFIDETYETRSAMMDKRQDIQMLLETSSPDKAKLTALSDDIMDLKKQMQTKRIEFVLAAKKIAPNLDMNDLRGLGFGKGRHHGRGFGGDAPCQGLGKGMGTGYGSGPCTQTTVQ